MSSKTPNSHRFTLPMLHAPLLRPLQGLLLAGILLLCPDRVAAAGPDNDAFANRTILSGADAVLPVYLLDATQEPGEPNHAPEPLVSSASIWWEWTAPSAGFLTLTPLLSQPSLAVYRGDALAGLEVLARSQTFDARMPGIPVSAGQIVFIAASLWTDAASAGVFVPAPASAQLRFHPLPGNDAFANRIRVSGRQVRLSGHTLGATTEAGEPTAIEAPNGATVWWEWTPTVSGVATYRAVEIAGGSLRAYRGDSLTSLQGLAELSGGSPFPVTAGEPIQFSAMTFVPQWGGPFEAVVSVSGLRIASPASGIALPVPGPLELSLEHLPEGLDRLVVLPGGLSFPVGTTLTHPHLGEGRHRVSVVGVSPEGDAFYSQEILVRVQAGNDAFASAAEVPGNPALLGGDFSVATLEPGEPALPAASAGGSVWWRWRAPATGRVMAGSGSLPQGSPVAIAEYFTGDTLGTLQPVPQQLEPGRLNLNTVFFASAGTTYWIRLSRPSDASAEWASLEFEFQPQAEGDAMGQAEVLPSGNFDRVLAHDYATVEPGEPGPDLPGVGSRWLVFTPPSDGVWGLDLENVWSIESQASLMVFEATGTGNLSPLWGPALSVSVPVTRGTPLLLRLAIPNDLPATLPLTLRSRFTAPPPNDAIASAETLSAEGGDRTGSNDLGTLEPGESPNEAGDRTVWYRFTAPEAGALQVRVASTPEAVFRHHLQWRFAQGDSVPAITWPDRQVFDGEWGVLELDAGESVLVVVGNTLIGAPGPTGFQLEHRFEGRPPNDFWSAAVDLGSPAYVSVRGTNWLATAEPGDPPLGQPAAGRTIWWRWTAPDSGLLEIGAPALVVGVFTGETLASLKPVTAADPPGSVLGGLRIPVATGAAYWIAVDRRASDALPRVSDSTGFDLTLQLGSLRLVQPVADAVLIEGTPLTLSVQPAIPSLDGAWTSVTYREGVVRGGFVLRTNLLTVRSAPFEAAGLAFPAGLHQVQAVATNTQGAVFHSPAVPFRVSPPHDDFANAAVLEGRHLTNPVTWSGSTLETGEPPGPATHRGTLWYRWTAPATGDLQVVVPAGTSFSLYTGTQLNALKALPTSGGGLGYRYSVQAGTEYRGRMAAPLSPVGVVSSGVLRWDLETAVIRQPGEEELFPAGQAVTLLLETTESPATLARVHFDEGSERIATLTAPPWRWVWQQPSSGRHTVTARMETVSGEILPGGSRTFRVGPGNDGFPQAVVLTGSSGREASNTLGATPEIPGDTSGDIWFEWTAPADGLLQVRSEGLGGFVQSRLYTGATVPTLQEVPNRIDSGGGFGRGEWAVSAGITYRLVVAQSNAESDGTPFDLLWEFLPPTPNDHFASRQPLDGESGDVLANVVLATLEPGEPDYGFDYPVIASVWWTWTPPRDGLLEIAFPDDNAPANSVRPMSGSSLSVLLPLDAIGRPPVFQPGPRLYPVAGGVPVSLVYVSGLANRSDLRWRWRFLPLPANDPMAAAASLEGTQQSVTGSTLGATHEPGEPFPSDSLFNTVWWRWTAPVDGDLLLTLQDLRQTHGIAVYRGASHLSATYLVNTWVNPTAPPSPLVLRVTAGETYQILVGSTEAPGQPFTLELGMRLRPANDNFAQRQRVEGSQWTVEGANWRSTREFREPLHHGRFGGRSVWYAWRAPADGEVALALEGAYSQFTLLAAYEGSRVDQLTEVASVEVGDWNAPLRFRARAGQEYALALDGASGAESGFLLALQLTPETSVPVVELRPSGDQGLQITTPGIPPGVWGLEMSFNLQDWALVMNLQASGPRVVDLPRDPEQPVQFFRVRRLE